MENFEQIGCQQAKEMIDKGDVIVVDCRDLNSYQEAHIENAIRVDDVNIEQFIKDADKEKLLVCYCYMGQSSQMACQYFMDQGFAKVYNIIGGFEEWRQNYPTTDPS